MKTTSRLLCTGTLICTLCAAFAACDGSQQDSELQGEEVPFTVYSPGEDASGEQISARWVNLDYDDNKDILGKALVIDSDEELERYAEGDYPPIDFSEKTLVLAYGATPRGLEEAKVSNFSRMSNGKYKLDVTVVLLDSATIDYWYIAIVTDKIGKNSKFEITVEFPKK